MIKKINRFLIDGKIVEVTMDYEELNKVYECYEGDELYNNFLHYLKNNSPNELINIIERF